VPVVVSEVHSQRKELEVAVGVPALGRALAAERVQKCSIAKYSSKRKTALVSLQYTVAFLP
jgi:hypothetical protein